MAVKHKKLKEWVAAGLMSTEQADSIHAYEEDRKSGRFGRGLVGLSLFAILVGVLSIIAANWNAIPGEAKIGVHLFLNVCVGLVALRAGKKGHDLWREGAALVFMGLTFTLIILIGQVFQLTGTPADAALFWLLITLPFFLLMGRGYMTAAPWMLAFIATVYLVMVEKIQVLPLEQRQLLATLVGVLLPLALMADGAIELFRKLRPALSDVALKAGIVLGILQTSVSLAFWPANQSYRELVISERDGLLTVIIGLGAVAIHAIFYRFYKSAPEIKGGAMLAAAGIVGTVIPLIFPSDDMAIIPALVFIAYWVFIGWLAQGMHKMRYVSLAIAVIAVRIFMIYVELFGSLIDTGFGLISGGIVMLVLIFAARRLNRRMTKIGGAA
jgi:uncharacterized membrane protein